MGVLSSYISIICLLISLISFVITFVYPDRWFQYRKEKFKCMNWDKYVKEYKSTMKFLQIYCLVIGVFLLADSSYAPILILPAFFSMFTLINIKNKYSI